MKLLNKYNRLNILVTVTIMFVTGIIYYYTISRILTNQIDKDLILEENEVFSYVNLNHRLPDVYQSNHQQILFTLLGNKQITRRFLDTVYRETGDNDLEAGRALISSVKVNGQNYRILVTQSKVETEDLIQIIFLITIGVIVILLVVLMVLNRVILKSIWQPFYKVLTQVKQFNLTDHPSISSIPSSIDEFTELDKAVTAMAGRVKGDYENLKAFTENASHELMTPISVINSKLDTLVQTDEFTDKQSKLLNDLYATVARLTRLNKSMLLLSKIENKVIRDNQEVNIKDIAEDCLYLHEEIIQQKNITLQVHLEDKQVQANKLLIEVLLNNLISNAIKHNHENGDITLRLNHESLSVSNSGNSSINFDHALKRFQKSDGSEGIGLGLTLCKQVCDNYGFTFSYGYTNNMHTFSVIF